MAVFKMSAAHSFTDLPHHWKVCHTFSASAASYSRTALGRKPAVGAWCARPQTAVTLWLWEQSQQ